MSFSWTGGCTGTDWLVALFALAIGGAVVNAARSETRRLSKFGAAALGATFVAAGAWMATFQMRCHAPLPDARELLGPLAWAWSTGAWITLAVALVFSQIAFGLRTNVRARAFSALSWIAFGMAAAEYRAFGMTAMGARWFVVGLLVIAAAMAVRTLRPDLREPDGPPIRLSL